MAGEMSSLLMTMSKLCVSTSMTMFCVAAASCFKETLAAEQSSELHNFAQPADNTQVMIFLSIVSAATFLIIAVFLVAACTDCYKSEVSTECHPATASQRAKWGGAGGYTSVTSSDVHGSIMGAGFSTGEQVLLPGEGNQPLPYSMIPSQVPEAQGFRGYGSAEPPAAQGYGAVAGYGLAGWGSESTSTNQGQSRGRTGSQSLPGAHVNPADVMVEPEEPPPPYYATSGH